MRVYLAGPMTGLPGHNFPAFEHWARQLHLAGHDVVSPRELSGHTLEQALGIPWEHHLRRDLQALLDCEGVVVMDGWARSRGALLEVETAVRVGMPVYQTERTGPDPEDLGLEQLDEATIIQAMNAARPGWKWVIEETITEETLDATTFDEAASGDVVVDPMTGAMKADGQKPRVDLLPPGPLQAISQVMAFGAAKYDDAQVGPYNWRRGFDWSRMYGAALRHLFAWWDGEDLDPETGLPHLSHAGCDILFLLEFVLKETGRDDRWVSLVRRPAAAEGEE